MIHLLYLIQEAQNRWQAGLMKRSLNHIMHCQMPWKAACTVFAGQTMQTPTVRPPAAAAIMRNINISAHSKGNDNPKAFGVQ